MSKFEIGDRVVKTTVDHYVDNEIGTNYGESEAPKGAVGTVDFLYAEDGYSVVWDRGGSSAIAGKCLAKETTAKPVTYKDLEAAYDEGYNKEGPFENHSYALFYLLEKFDITWKES